MLPKSPAGPERRPSPSSLPPRRCPQIADSFFWSLGRRHCNLQANADCASRQPVPVGPACPGQASPGLDPAPACAVLVRVRCGGPSPRGAARSVSIGSRIRWYFSPRVTICSRCFVGKGGPAIGYTPIHAHLGNARWGRGSAWNVVPPPTFPPPIATDRIHPGPNPNIDESIRTLFCRLPTTDIVTGVSDDPYLCMSPGMWRGS